jgi:hypothetical protein
MMLFRLRYSNIGVKNFESMTLLENVRYSHGPSLNTSNHKSEKNLNIYLERARSADSSRVLLILSNELYMTEN